MRVNDAIAIVIVARFRAYFDALEAEEFVLLVKIAGYTLSFFNLEEKIINLQGFPEQFHLYHCSASCSACQYFG